jgi:hypothetical protein
VINSLPADKSGGTTCSHNIEELPVTIRMKVMSSRNNIFNMFASLSAPVRT